MKRLILLLPLLFICSCSTIPLSTIPLFPNRPPEVPSLNPLKSDVAGYGFLDWAAGIGVVVAVGFVLASIWLPGPKMRLTAGAGVGIAVGAWALKFVMVKYLPIALLISAVLALAFMGLFIWGHRWWFEHVTKLDLNGDGKIGK